MNAHRPLTEEEKQALLRLARHAIKGRLENRTYPPPPLTELPERLRVEGASFVTLTLQEALRGCIGSLQATRPLAHDVHHNALAAAFQDPRFPPLRAPELDQITIEVSALTAPQSLEYEGPEELIQKLRPDIDGVVLRQGMRSATFLPQVWEKLPRPEEFLANLCYKAGLSSNAWRQPETEIKIYQVDKFSEAG